MFCDLKVQSFVIVVIAAGSCFEMRFASSSSDLNIGDVERFPKSCPNISNIKDPHGKKYFGTLSTLKYDQKDTRRGIEGI